MATGSEDPTDLDDVPDECTLCLEPFSDPRFLPCHHTFCVRCIHDLVDQNEAKEFPCPCCRKGTTLPPDGVSKLPKNFYIKRQKRRDTTKCSIHDDQLVKYYCMPCGKAICIDCKVTNHEGHRTQDLQTAVDRIKGELTGDQDRIKRAIDKVRDKHSDIQSQKAVVYNKRSEVEKAIQDRHATLAAINDKLRDEALASLHSVAGDIVSTMDTDLKRQEQNQQQLLDIQQKIQHVVTDGTGRDAIAVARMINSGRGNTDAVKKLTSQPIRRYGYPVLRQDTTKQEVVLDTLEQLFGSVVLSAMLDAEMTVEKMFNCGKTTNTRVFSICHIDTDPAGVLVSYEQSERGQSVVAKGFLEGGQFVGDGDKVGRVTSKRISKGECMDVSSLKGDTYTKSLTAAHFKLTNDFRGKGNICKVSVTSADPLKTRDTVEFSVNVRRHRTVDVDDSEQVFVVVEEPRAPDVRRKVLMYRRPNQDPVSTYRPPYPDFNPSDVCFYTVGGQHVLLVSDEANDRIHVVRVGDDRFTFLRYLTSACPLLVQPTAMNVDMKGRLWVACKGGNIFTIKPME